MESQLFPTEVLEWTWETIESLRENEQEENRYLEYKAHLHYPEDENDKSKTEWRHNIEAEITAFANANGGILLFGVGDDRTPIPFEPPEHDVARTVNQFIQNSTPVPQVDVSTMRAPTDEVDRIIVVVRVHEATRKPVMTSKSACYVRITESKHPMSREQIESMFVEADRRQQAVRQLEMEIEQFLDIYEETFDDYLLTDAPPDYYLINKIDFYRVFQENTHLYSDEEVSQNIRNILSELRKIELGERYERRLKDGEVPNPFEDSKRKNVAGRQELERQVNRLKNMILQLIESADLDVEPR
ncbi:Putative DNA-binding domain-containing protein [Halopelagius inordinatus]|uniref:Putative DNA-binding domain-containing protein n=1 Tax=Halopelagius inordinatus TaxID=553467 RepID=A0A1I2RCD7_9EURY|nr:ATP-binding protein [Halopelagius inordinatus]SFG35466.1 Putative DNA-binding domain-containing protein [Halopelagius inordinatus]